MREAVNIEELVSDGTNLYARVVWDEGFVNLETNNIVYRLTGTGTTLVAAEISNSLATDHPLINRISVANGTLVASVKRRGISGDIRYVYESAGSFVAFGGSTDLGEGSAIIAASFVGETYYFATGNGLFYGALDDNAPTVITATSGTEISGIRAFGTELLAWSHGGTLYRINASTTTPSATSSATSAELEMANTIYDNGTFVALLIAYNNSATRNGYRELALGASDTLPSSLSLSTPGDPTLSSTIDEAQYSSSMGRYLVYGLQQWQIGSRNVLFAGTKMGLYYSVNRGAWKVWSSGTHNEFN